MKELSIEEKAKRYDEVVAMAKERITHVPDEAVNEYMLNMFPELKESKVGKPNGGIVSEDFNEGDGFYKVNLAYLSKEQVEEIESLVKKWNPESEDERIRKELIKLLRNLFNNYSYFIKDPFYTECIAWLEKQREQKPYSQMEKCINCQFNMAGYCNGTCILKNKVESKFKVGDWISNGQYTRLVVGISFDLGDYYYMFEDGMSKRIEHIDKKCHLWSIEDAKDGNMLVSVSNQPFIYNGKFTECTVGAYCGLNVYGDFYVKSGWTDNKDIRPATKEQRDFLLKEMHRADYEWDAEKKELKKMISIFPFQAKIKQTGKIITIIAGQLDTEGKKYIQYQSDKNDGYSVYSPNDFEKLNC